MVQTSFDVKSFIEGLHSNTENENHLVIMHNKQLNSSFFAAKFIN